ncbi:MAG: hypothetical protein IPJ74_12900 [Saprospiraceae bacterium]|nr:hypothetical protein [Saprospiraceae bacterium]
MDTDIITTDTSGKFDFAAHLVTRDAYTARFTKTEEIATNGISTYDIVRVQRHLLGIEPFESPYEYLAADVDRSSSVSIADIIHLRKLVLSIESSLPTFQPWLFINGNYTFSNQINPFVEAYSGNATSFPITAQGVIPPISVIAIKVGDLDFNAK